MKNVTSEQKARYIARSLLSLPANFRHIDGVQTDAAGARELSKSRTRLIAEVLKYVKRGFLDFNPQTIHRGTTHNLAGWIELIVLQAYGIRGAYRPEYAYQQEPPFWGVKDKKNRYSPLITERYQTTGKYETLAHPINRWARDFCNLTHGEGALLFGYKTDLQLIEATVNLLSQGYRLKSWQWFVPLNEREYQLSTFEELGIIFDLSPEGLTVFKSAWTKEEL